MSVYIPGYRQTGPLSYASQFKNNVATHYDISDVSMIRKDEKMAQKRLSNNIDENLVNV